MKNKPEFTSFEQMCQRLDALSASKAKLAPEALSQVAALQELQDRAFNEEADEDVQRRGRRRRLQRHWVFKTLQTGPMA